jgi:hypothetical protein
MVLMQCSDLTCHCSTNTTTCRMSWRHHYASSYSIHHKRLYTLLAVNTCTPSYAAAVSLCYDYALTTAVGKPMRMSNPLSQHLVYTSSI